MDVVQIVILFVRGLNWSGLSAGAIGVRVTINQRKVGSLVSAITGM